MTWNDAQKWESGWWGNCINTIGEELKQFAYAEKMGLTIFHDQKSPFNINASRMNICDIGGGPASMLLKTSNRGDNCVVIDPILDNVPGWVKERYNTANIKTSCVQGENLLSIHCNQEFQEVWIYNVLQHTQNPELIIKNAKQISKIIRIFEWIDTPINKGHPHSLNERKMNNWLGGIGKAEYINKNTAVGKAYYGVFPVSEVK